MSPELRQVDRIIVVGSLPERAPPVEAASDNLVEIVYARRAAGIVQHGASTGRGVQVKPPIERLVTAVRKLLAEFLESDRASEVVEILDITADGLEVLRGRCQERHDGVRRRHRLDGFGGERCGTARQSDAQCDGQPPPPVLKVSEHDSHSLTLGLVRAIQ